MALKPKAERAGAYAHERYRRGLRNWRSRTRPVFAAVFGPFILAGLAVLIIEGHPWPWIAGAVTGAFSGAWLVMRDEPPAYIENWRAGAEGERKTAKALRPLQRSGLRVLHDVQARYGNYDHVAVGRAGVFLLETKNPKGVVELRNGVPHMRRRLDPDADTRLDSIRLRALAAAVRLKERHRASNRPPRLGAGCGRLLVGLPRRSPRRRPVHLHPRLATSRLDAEPPRQARSGQGRGDRSRDRSYRQSRTGRGESGLASARLLVKFHPSSAS
jgi:hypothetical protein